MPGINAFERRLERMVDGVFARAFRSSLRPIEIGRKLVREIDDHRSVDVKGRIIVPNQFTVTLSASDLEQFGEIHEALVHELCDAAREYARDEGYTFMGPVAVDLVESPAMKTGRFKVEGKMVEAATMAGAGSIVLPTGDRIVLGEETITIGRLPELRHPGSRPEREPQARRDPSVGRRLRRRRSRVDERHSGQRRDGRRAAVGRRRRHLRRHDASALRSLVGLPHMSENMLALVLRICLLALLYLFFLRVVRAVWVETVGRGPRAARR